jgi:hypothetical protein
MQVQVMLVAEEVLIEDGLEEGDLVGLEEDPSILTTMLVVLYSSHVCGKEIDVMLAF